MNRREVLNLGGLALLAGCGVKNGLPVQRDGAKERQLLEALESVLIVTAAAKYDGAGSHAKPHQGHGIVLPNGYYITVDHIVSDYDHNDAKSIGIATITNPKTEQPDELEEILREKSKDVAVFRIPEKNRKDYKPLRLELGDPKQVKAVGGFYFLGYKPDYRLSFLGLPDNALRIKIESVTGPSIREGAFVEDLADELATFLDDGKLLMRGRNGQTIYLDPKSFFVVDGDFRNGDSGNLVVGHDMRVYGLLVGINKIKRRGFVVKIDEFRPYVK